MLDLALWVIVILTAGTSWKMFAGSVLILAFLLLAPILWLISTYLIYTGSKDIWKDFNN